MACAYPTWSGWPGGRAAVVAEVGINHGGDPHLAWEMIRAAGRSGADFVKLQTFHTENLLHTSVDYFDKTRSLELSDSAQEDLFRRAREAHIPLVTTPFDEASLELAERFDPPFHKVASMDLDNLPLLERVGRTGRPVVVSCGMSDLAEIQAVTRLMDDFRNDKLVLLHCVSDYPAQEEALNLAMIPMLRAVFDRPVGFSDHTVGLDGAFVAASLGAVLIEEHFTLDRTMAGSMPDADHELSIQPEELERLRRFCEAVPAVIGRAPRRLTENENDGRRANRRGLYARVPIAAGECLALDNVAFLRPVAGIPAGAWNEVCGRRTVSALLAGQSITFASVGL